MEKKSGKTWVETEIGPQFEGMNEPNMISDCVLFNHCL